MITAINNIEAPITAANQVMPCSVFIFPVLKMFNLQRFLKHCKDLFLNFQSFKLC